VEEVGVVGRAAGRQRRREDRARVGMSLDAREHA
jgi:hypothetical protein